jgi:hypothetical protein
MFLRCVLATLLGVFFVMPASAEISKTISPERPGSVRCGVQQLRAALGDEIWTQPQVRGGPCGATPVGPPPNPQVGDSWNWYTWRLNGFPAADLKSCTVRGMGDHCYVVVEDSQWNVNVNQTQVDTIVDHFENESIGSFPTQGIWTLNTTHFGMPPDNIDLDPRVYILYYDFDVSSDGFFWSFDQECDNVAQFHSNEADVVYMNCSDFDPAGSYLLAVLAHEFQHLIHFNQDPNEEAWVDEGMGELAMWLYGNPDNVVQFNGNPDRQLNTFSGNFYDYVKTYLWSLYFYERYGGQPAILSLVDKSQNGILGFEVVLDEFLYPENFTDVFSDWTVANYLDDTSIGDGRYGYVGETLPAFVPFATFSTYPVGPNPATVNHWAADYVRYLSGNPLQTSFDGSDNSLFRVRALLLDNVNPTQIVDMTLGAGQVGTLSLPQLGGTHDEAVLVYSKTSGAGLPGYIYGATAGAVDSPEPSWGAELSMKVLNSVSARPAFVLSAPGVAGVRLDIFDVSGRSVRRLVDGATIRGTQTIEWDGRGDSAQRLAPGTYFARMSAEGFSTVARTVLIR